MSRFYELSNWNPDQSTMERMQEEMLSQMDEALLRKNLAGRYRTKVSSKILDAIARGWANNKLELYAMLGNRLTVESDVSWIEDRDACMTRFQEAIIAKYPMHALSLSSFSSGEIAKNEISSEKKNLFIADAQTPRKVTTAVARCCQCKELEADLRAFYNDDGVCHGKVGLTIDPTLLGGDMHSSTITSPYVMTGYMKDPFGKILCSTPIYIYKNDMSALFTVHEACSTFNYVREVRRLYEEAAAAHCGFENRWLVRKDKVTVHNLYCDSMLMRRITPSHLVQDVYSRFEDGLNFNTGICPVCGAYFDSRSLACGNCVSVSTLDMAA